MSELGTEMNRTESYNPVTQEWCQLSAMLTSRAYIALAALDGCLYAVGGWNEDGGALSMVEKYSIEEVRSCCLLVSLSVGGEEGLNTDPSLQFRALCRITFLSASFGGHMNLNACTHNPVEMCFMTWNKPQNTCDTHMSRHN